jgi:transposase-like protein
MVRIPSAHLGLGVSLLEENFPAELPRVPPPFEGIQVNFCKNFDCGHFGSPASTEKQPRGPGAASRPNDGYTIDVKGNFRRLLVCRSCGQGTMCKSNQAVHEEFCRLRAYLVPPVRGCRDAGCPNYHMDVSAGKAHYQHIGRTEIGSQRYRCKACKATFSISARSTARQRSTYKNKILFKLLVNHIPFKRICEVLDISEITLYRRIDFLHRQCLAFAASRERLIPTLQFPQLYVACDRQEFTLNWTDTEDKRNVILKAIASVEVDSGFVFGMHPNFDPTVDPKAVEDDTKATGDEQKPLAFRKYARLWLAGDHARMARRRNRKKEPIPEGGLLLDVAARYEEALQREDIEVSDDPDPDEQLPPLGVQIHEEYTLYGHFFFLRQLLAGAQKVCFYLDQDSGMRAACLAGFRDRVLDGRCDAFYVRINKDLNIHQRERIVQRVKAELEEAKAAHPFLSADSVRILRILDEVKRLETVGRWEDRWLKYPFPDKSEPEKAVCYLTDRRNYQMELSSIAELYLKASLHAVDSYFNQVRTRLSPLRRAPTTPSNEGRRWYGYQPYRPDLVQKLLDLLRVYRNYCLKSRKDKKTPAMRLGLAKAPIDLDTVIHFQP